MAPLWKRPGFLAGGALVYASSTFVTYLTLYEPKQDAVPAMTDDKRLQVFNANAAQYDKEVNVDEALTGISLMRRVLLQRARGRVLEIAAGTGRNLAYYADDAQLTLTDFSAGMLQQIPAEQRARVAECELRVMSATQLDFPSGQFDTVVDTFGLCSMDDSVRALREMQRVCRHDGSGRILLLEHGRSHYAWLSGVLDKFAALHAQKWGCHWNRDIVALVEEAGLEIESLHRFHFGTTYYIVAKPSTAASTTTEKAD